MPTKPSIKDKKSTQLKIAVDKCVGRRLETNRVDESSLQNGSGDIEASSRLKQVVSLNA